MATNKIRKLEVSMPDDLYQKIKDLSEEERISKAAIARMAIKFFFEAWKLCDEDTKITLVSKAGIPIDVTFDLS